MDDEDEEEEEHDHGIGTLRAHIRDWVVTPKAREPPHPAGSSQVPHTHSCESIEVQRSATFKGKSVQYMNRIGAPVMDYSIMFTLIVQVVHFHSIAK